MNPLKKLAQQTAVYGLSTIVGRLLNYFLVPLYTSFFVPEEYGVVSELYAYIGFLVVLLMFGVETAFFRFYSQEETKTKAFNTGFSMLLVVNGLFLILALALSSQLAALIKYPDQQYYIVLLALIVTTDALSSLPLAKLRAEERAKKFVTVQLAAIFTNIGFNLLFILILKNYYYPEMGVVYIFVANLISSLVKPLMLLKEFKGFRFVWNNDLRKKMLVYSFPLVLAGLAGIINETLDRILLKFLLYEKGESYAMAQVGIYSACYKLSIIITIFIQAFRYAAEPFFFAESKKDNPKRTYVKVMNFFIIIMGLIFLGVMLYIDLFKWFIPNSDYWAGLGVVPILLLANICLGIYYNQSIWYKLSDRTRFGAYLAMGGALITIVLNVILIPVFGYFGSAWATLAAYGSMMVASYFFGQSHYPIPYNLRKAGLYVGLALLFYGFSVWIKIDSAWIKYSFHTSLILIYLAVGYFLEISGKKKILG